jgi:glutathione S-transferase
MITLFHAPRSRSSRFVWLLEEIGEPYEIEYISIAGRDGGRDAKNPHPHGKAPALIHDGALVTESAAIALYLSDAFPAASLGPRVGETGRADYVSWLAYYAGNIEPAMVAKATDWSSPVGMTGWSSFEDMETRIAERLEAGPWMLGERFSTVDILVGSLLQWAAKMFPERPAYDAFKARFMERPALARALARDDAPA